MPKKVAVGVVTNDKMQKTRRVEIPRLVKHPVYGKYIRQRTVCHVHDEDEASSIGDTVEIIETQPQSKMKRWNGIQRYKDIERLVLVLVILLLLFQTESD